MCLWYVQQNDGDWFISWNSVSGLGDPWPCLVLHQGMSRDLWLPWGEPLYNSLQWPELGEQLESQQRGQSGLKWELSILGASDQREEETQQKLVNRGNLALSVTQNSLVFMWSATTKYVGSPPSHHWVFVSSGPRASSCHHVKLIARVLNICYKTIIYFIKAEYYMLWIWSIIASARIFHRDKIKHKILNEVKCSFSMISGITWFLVIGGGV